MKKYLYKIIFVTCIVFFGSCTDLTETPYDVITDDNIEFNDNDITSLSGEVFNNLRYMYWAWNGYFDTMEESSDLMMTPLRIGVGWGDLYVSMHKHQFNASIGHFWTIWNYGFLGINAANTVLDMEGVQKNKEKVAELRTLRALFYYVLFDCFRNIPLETTMQVSEGYMPKQVAPQEIFDFMVKELIEAKEDLETEKKYGYPNKYVASMLLAKIYINHNAWFNDFSSNEYYEKALAELEIVFEGGYSLASTYKECFLADLSGNSEVIFGIPLDGTYASHNYTVNKALVAEGAKAFGYDGAPWNGSCAIPQFIDSYAEGDKRLADTWAYGQQYHYKTGEKLRMIADEGSEVNLIYTKKVHSIDNPGAYMLEGYRFVKNEIVEGTDGTYGDDVPFFRLADAMFMKAECLLRLGRDETTAAQLVTDVRMRSFDNPADATRTVEDLKGASVYAYGHQEYTGVGSNNWTGLIQTHEGSDDIELGGLLDDLAWEFVGEHHRRQDLIRFRLANGQNVYNGKSWFCKEALTDIKDVHNNIFPIPQGFLDSNTNLDQNPGFSGAE